MTDLNKNNLARNNLGDANKEVSELKDAELDAVSGGNAIQDTVAAVAKAAAQVVTGNTGKCTDHWYSD